MRSRSNDGHRSPGEGALLARLRRWFTLKTGSFARGKRSGGLTLEALEDRSLLAVSSWVSPGFGGQLLYTPDDQADRIPDFSQVGYRGSLVPLPDLPVRATVNPGPGDDGGLIQAAIDQVATLPLDANGFRGTVLLTTGEYQIAGHLEIRASGIVLRGQGDSETGTILRATGTDPRTLVQVFGTGNRTQVAGTLHNITDSHVPVGARSFQVDSTDGLRVGDTVVVNRPSTASWIQAISMDQLTTPWMPGTFDLNFDRVITRIEGNRITLDAPLVNALDQQYGGGTIYRYTWSGRIENVGIENLRGMSDFVSPTDEAHARSLIDLIRVQNAWVRNVTGRHFVFATVWAQNTSKWVTVQDCRSLDPVSVIAGDRRYPFLLHGQLGLVRDCYSVEGRHDYATGALTTGPNVFVDSRAEQSHDDSGPHHRWGVGALFDNLNVQPAGAPDATRKGNIDLENRGNVGPGHGWAGANMVIWNSTAGGGFIVHNPPTAQNWLIGSTGVIEPGQDFVGPTQQAVTDSHSTPVLPRSLYYAQLQQRLLHPGLEDREYSLGDIDQFTGGQFTDAVSVDPSWRAAVQAQTGLPLHGFDAAGAHWVPFTFDFTLGPNEQVVGASLSLGLRATTGDGSSDRLYLDGLGTSFTMAELGWAPLTASSTAGRVFDLNNRLALLQDGRLNLALASNAAIDWAVLNLRVAPVFTDTTTTLGPIADATVIESAPGQNFGTQPTLEVQRSTPGTSKEALLRFDLSSLTTAISDARIRLVPVSVGTAGIENAAAFVASDGWGETSVTWTSRPTSGSAFASWVPSTGQAVEFSVTTQVQEALAGDGMLSLRLFSTTDLGAAGLVTYGSREGAADVRPQLLLTPFNAPPNSSDIPDQTTSEDTSLGPIAFTLSDDQTPVGALVVTASSSNPMLVPDANIVLGGSGANRTLTLTPTANQFGTTTITLTIRDAGGRTGIERFDLLVLAANDAPSSGATTAATTQGVPVDVELRTLVSDLETPLNQLLFRVSGAVNGSVALLADGHTARFTPAPGYTGPARFNYTVTDIGYGSNVLLHYGFEPPDASTDSQVTDAAPAGRRGTLQQIGGGTFAFVPDVPPVLSPLTSRSLELVENGDLNAARLTRVVAPSELDFNNHDWTFAGWFQRRDADNDDILFHVGAGDGFGGENELYIIASGSSNVAVHHYAGVGDRDVLLLRSGITPGTWHHAAVVFTAAGGGTGTLAFYIDGTLVGMDSDFSLVMDQVQPVVFGGHASVTSTTMRWFDGKIDDLILLDSALAPAAVTSLATGSAGHREGLTAGPVTVQVTVGAANRLHVTSFTPTATGFTAQLSGAINAAVLNLYDAAGAGLGAADVTLRDASGNLVRGSLVLNTAATQFTFIRTGGVLPPGDYTATFRGTTDGFRSQASGEALDGDSDGIAGGDYTATFTILPPLTAVVSLPDFARGPGQTIDLPLRLSASAGVTSVSLKVRYDTGLLTITAATLPNGVVGSVSLDTTSMPGTALVTFTGPALSAGITEFVRLTATVPQAAASRYAAKQVLDLFEVMVNGAAAVDDDGLHVLAYLGDATANGSYSAGDATQLLRVAVGLSSGFSTFRLADSVIIADVVASGSITSLDATRVLQEAVGFDRPEIPNLPPGPPLVTVSGPDPLLHFGKLLRARQGQTVTLPLLLDPSEGLEHADLAISYDTERLELVQVRRGRLTRDFDLFLVNHDREAGTIRVGMGRTAGPAHGQGSVLEVTVRVRTNAPAGRAVINLRQNVAATLTQLNEGGLDLNPDPSNSAGDVLDGIVLVRSTNRSLREVREAERRSAKGPSSLDLVDAVFALSVGRRSRGSLT